MPRVSRKVAEENRAQMVAAASRLVRAGGADAVTVAAVTEAAGLTQGAFYKQFASKEALIAEACAVAVAERREDFDGVLEGGPRADAWQNLVQEYLSVEHRDRTGEGCPVAGLAPVAARSADPDVRAIYRSAVEDLLDVVEHSTGKSREDAVRAAAELVGALMLARALGDDDLSDEVLRAVRSGLLDAER